MGKEWEVKSPNTGGESNVADASPRETPWGQITQAGLVNCDSFSFGFGVTCCSSSLGQYLGPRWFA